MIKYLNLILLCFTTVRYVHTQELFSDTSKYINEHASKEFRSINANNLSVEVGSGITFFSKRNAFLTNYIYPNFSYNIAPRFNFNAGIIVLKNHLNSNSTLLYTEDYFQIPSTSIFFVGEGEYSISNKLKFHTNLLKEIDHGLPEYPDKPNKYQYISVGLDFKISKSVSIGFQFINSNNNSFSTYPFMVY